MSSFYLNRIQYNAPAKIYNLDADLVDGVSIYIIPITLSTDVSGYSEMYNNKLWLLEPNGDSSHKVSVSVDGTVYNIKSTLAGSSATNPIVYRRVSGSNSIDVTEDGTNKKIYPLFGNDTTMFGTDWMRHINIGNNTLSDIKSLPSSGNEILDLDYFGNHIINKNANDYMTFDVLINATNGSGLYNTIQSKLDDCTFVVHKTIYNKNITSGLDVIYGQDFKKFNDNEIGVRF